jgi:GH15 family glucan-1,4-alpha-glucosidase
LRDGLLLRYLRTPDKQEGAFLACSFWLVGAYALGGRRAEAERLFEKLLALRNDLGLLSEEYDTGARRLIGNFPQGFSHLALITAAQVLSGALQPAGAR